MIISRTPLRVSFFGGGTDYPAYFRRHGGETLVTTINKYLTVSVHDLADLFEHRIQVHYSRVESVAAVDDIEISVVRETLRHLAIAGGVEIHLVGDIPARTGLGNSSATTVGLLTALHAYLGHPAGRSEIAAQAVWVEQSMIGETVGCQDQYACAHGGFLHLSFTPDGTVKVDPVMIDERRLGELASHLMLFYTGIQRHANEVLGEQVRRTGTGELDGPLTQMRDHVGKALRVLQGSGELADFGRLLNESWQLKRVLSARVSTAWLDGLYAKAQQAGALGGKLLGAGGGGFMLLFAEPECHDRLRDALAPLREVPFAFESGGTRLVFND